MRLSGTEREIRQAVLRTAQRMLGSGLVQGTAGNISARLPEGRVILTPAARAYDTMTVEDLVIVDARGETVDGHLAPTTELALHLACLRRHAEIGAVVHTHAVFASMFAVTRQPVPCVIEEVGICVGGDVPVAHYERTGSPALGEEVAGWLGDRSAVIMANHGLITVGATPDEALEVALLVERTARIVWGARQLGPIHPLPEDTVAHFAALYRQRRQATGR